MIRPLLALGVSALILSPASAAMAGGVAGSSSYAIAQSSPVSGSDTPSGRVPAKTRPAETNPGEVVNPEPGASSKQTSGGGTTAADTPEAAGVSAACPGGGKTLTATQLKKIAEQRVQAQAQAEANGENGKVAAQGAAEKQKERLCAQ